MKKDEILKLAKDHFNVDLDPNEKQPVLRKKLKELIAANTAKK